MSRRLKDNVFVRGLYFGLQSLRAWMPRRGNFAYCADNVVITPPYMSLIIKTLASARMSVSALGLISVPSMPSSSARGIVPLQRG